MVEGGTAHGKGPITKINLCALGCPPAPVYKGARGRPAGLGGAPREGGVLLPVGGGLPFPSPTRFGEGKEKGGRGRRKGGPRPPLLVQFGLLMGGARATSWCSPLSPLVAHCGPLLPRGFR